MVGITRRICFTLLAGAAAAIAAWLPVGPALAEDPARTPVVVELFTSQGCSSCPPADELIEELAGRDDVLALSEHVDYWDYIGWEDPFARPEATKRQNAYADALNERFVYTPQIIVDGRASVVGSRRSEVETAIEEARRSIKVRPRVWADGRIHIPAGETDRPAVVWLVVFERERQTRVERGENAGRTITNANIVREWRRIGTWTGEDLDLTVSLSDGVASGRDGCAVIIQANEGTGPILGAAQLPPMAPME